MIWRLVSLSGDNQGEDQQPSSRSVRQMAQEKKWRKIQSITGSNVKDVQNIGLYQAGRPNPKPI